MIGLNVYEANALREARDLLQKKPDAVLAYLGGPQPPTKALIALALSAQLQMSKAHLNAMHVTTALCKFLKVGEEKQDETPND